MEYTVVFQSRIVFISVIFYIASHKQEMRIETAKWKTNYLKQQIESFQCYCCQLGFAIFAWGFTWNYAHSPFNILIDGYYLIKG